MSTFQVKRSAREKDGWTFDIINIIIIIFLSFHPTVLVIMNVITQPKHGGSKRVTVNIQVTMLQINKQARKCLLALISIQDVVLDRGETSHVNTCKLMDK